MNRKNGAYPTLVCLVLAGMSPLYATKVFEPYGLIDYSYLMEDASSSVNESERTQFTQKYLLGTRGYIYSPRLLQYLLEGSFFLSESESSTDGEATDTTNKAVNYRTNLNFIQATSYPFIISAEKTTNPYGMTQPGATIDYTQNSESYGLSGSVNLSPTTIRYAVTRSNLDRVETHADERRNNTQMMISMYRNFTEGSAMAVYTDRHTDYFRDDRYYGSLQQWSDHHHDARMSLNWNFDKTLRIDTYANYMSSSYTGMDSISAGANLNWRPNDDFSGGLNLNANVMDANGTTSTTVSMAEYAMYRVNSKLTATQNLSLFQLSGDYLSQNIGSMSVGASYVDILENALSYNVNANFTARAERNEVSDDINTTMPDRNTAIMTFSAGASRFIDTLASNISVNGTFYESLSDLDEEMRRMSLNMILSTSTLYNFRYRFGALYTLEDGSYYTGNDTGMITRNIETYSIDNALQYSKDLGYKGRLSANVGVTYAVSKMDDSESVKRLFPHADVNLNYTLAQNLLFNSHLSASQDTVTDLTNYSAYMGLNYRIRQLVMSLGSNFFIQTGGNGSDLSRSTHLFKISRGF